MQPEIDVFGAPSRRSGSCSRWPSSPRAIVGRRLQELGKPADWAYEMVFAALDRRPGRRARSTGSSSTATRSSDDLLGGLFGGSGLVWYGGAVGGAVGVLHLGLVARACSTLALLDLGAIRRWPSATRSGGSAASSPATATTARPATLPWAMAYPDGTVPTTEEVHPTPIYETLAMGLVAWAAVALARPLPARARCSRSTWSPRASSASSSSSCAATTSRGARPHRARSSRASRSAGRRHRPRRHRAPARRRDAQRHPARRQRSPQAREGRPRGRARAIGTSGSWAGQAVSTVGDALNIVALAVFALERGSGRPAPARCSPRGPWR